MMSARCWRCSAKAIPLFFFSSFISKSFDTHVFLIPRRFAPRIDLFVELQMWQPRLPHLQLHWVVDTSSSTNSAGFQGRLPHLQLHWWVGTSSSTNSAGFQ